MVASAATLETQAQSGEIAGASDRCELIKFPYNESIVRIGS